MTLPTLMLCCPAKLNLFLHITGQRSDGYHNLQTMFQLLDYSDELRITPSEQPGIHFNCPTMTDIPAQHNLVVKAGQALLAHCRLREAEVPGVSMKLHKVLPIGGGIGGGSSNAASALIGLNIVWNLGLDTATLATIARCLGADVPVFVHGHSAWAEGIGEKLEAVDLPEKWFVVIKPGCSISTIDIFSHKELTRDSDIITLAAFLEVGAKNDCQPLVERLYPKVKCALRWLDQYGPARLTGTGSCIFASFDNESKAREVFSKRPALLDGFVAKGVNESPLHLKLRCDASGV